MEINIDDYDINRIRAYLEDYYGTAMMNTSSFAMVDLIDLSKKSDYEILVMAVNMGINLDNYYVGRRY